MKKALSQIKMKMNFLYLKSWSGILVNHLEILGLCIFFYFDMMLQVCTLVYEYQVLYLNMLKYMFIS